MEMRALINVYRELYRQGKITGAGIERHNELMKSYDSKTHKRIAKVKLIKVKKK